MKAARRLFLLLSALLVSIFCVSEIYAFRTRHQMENISGFGHLPSPAAQALSFEFKGVVSDYLFLKTMAFMGQKLMARENPDPAEWGLIHQALVRVTDLDPWFWDAYLFAESMLAWQAGMLKETNELLLKAAENLPWDHRPYFFLGFNHFYFAKEPANAAEYLREAAKKPGAPSYLKGLAARFSLYGNQTEAGLIFLDDLIRQTPNPGLRQYLEKRFSALEIIYKLEKKVQDFKTAKGRIPLSFQELIEAGFLEKVPEDPYGGELVLLGNGRIYTTSELVEKKPENKK